MKRAVLNRSQNYGSVMRNAMKRHMVIPTREPHYWAAKPSLWERHGTKILAGVMFLIIWYCVHLLAVGL